MQLLQDQVNVCHVQRVTVAEVMVYRFLVSVTMAHIGALQIQLHADLVLLQPICHIEEEPMFLNAYRFLQAERQGVKVLLTSHPLILVMDRMFAQVQRRIRTNMIINVAAATSVQEKLPRSASFDFCAMKATSANAEHPNNSKAKIDVQRIIFALWEPPILQPEIITAQGRLQLFPGQILFVIVLFKMLMFAIKFLSTPKTPESTILITPMINYFSQMNRLQIRMTVSSTLEKLSHSERLFPTYLDLKCGKMKLLRSFEAVLPLPWWRIQLHGWRTEYY